MRGHFSVLMCCAALAIAQEPAAAPVKIQAADLVGAWRLVKIETVRPNAEVIYPFYGKHPEGLIIYDASGWMSVQITGAMPGTISRDDFLKLPAADRAPWLNEYYAYYGTFEIDEIAHVVTHHIVSSLLPYETATTLRRDVALNGDVLTLLTAPRDEGGGKTFNRLVWKKST